MPYELKPLPFEAKRLTGLSERLILSHYENNYGGAVKRLNSITEQLGKLGTITGAVVVLGKRSITDIPTLGMLLITILLLLKVKKLPEPVIIAAAAVAGLIAFPLLKS